MKYYVFCQSDLVLEKAGDDYKIPENPPTELKPWTTVVNVDGDKAYRIDRPITDSERYEMCPLRQSFYKLAEADYRRAGKCHELLYWEQNTKFCGVCGGPMRFDTDISKKCEHCGKEIWPQLATAIIVLISREVPADDGSTPRKEVLLVHANSFRDNHYGLVAGFVETGETLEEAVYREVMEETGLHIKNLRYFGSQPWPYPCGLMVGYTAEYDSGQIHLQRSELSKGAWFNRNNLPHIPEKLSIARQLLDHWLAKEHD
ncbi:MAG: NAD(+) diphosphatase [Prevotella sp.]|nr:NAD(+) diphosphatase [Prevotella sp.]